MQVLLLNLRIIYGKVSVKTRTIWYVLNVPTHTVLNYPSRAVPVFEKTNILPVHKDEKGRTRIRLTLSNYKCTKCILRVDMSS